MSPWFADTFFFLALANPADEAHTRATELLRAARRRIVTTEFVFMEVGDALFAPDTRPTFRRLVEAHRRHRNVELVPASTELFSRGVELFSGRADKDWSLTDCTSFVVMADRAIPEALTGDRHFEQAGFVALLK